jgi:hypothetical protein
MPALYPLAMIGITLLPVKLEQNFSSENSYHFMPALYPLAMIGRYLSKRHGTFQCLKGIIHCHDSLPASQDFHHNESNLFYSTENHGVN